MGLIPDVGGFVDDAIKFFDEAFEKKYLLIFLVVIIIAFVWFFFQ